MKGLINKEQYERLKKALEVEDESWQVWTNEYV
jgi:hypothetical protein